MLLDNRTLYLDFFGFVMWDYVPLDVKEIKQIEVVRGPGSAVWGANAMSGVINLITKSPQEMEGTSVTLGGGRLRHPIGTVTHAGVGGKLGYKISAAYYEQDEPYDRPDRDHSAASEGPTNPDRHALSGLREQGHPQPKINVRVDYDQSERRPGSSRAATAGPTASCIPASVRSISRAART